MAGVKAPDTTLTYDQSKCTGCRTCTEVCPHAVFAMNEKKAHLVRIEDCMECGACALNCREGAISVESGVGCASGMIAAALSRKKEIRCC